MRGWIKKGVDAYLNYNSFKTNRKFVIIESDDWGSLRTKDKSTRQRLNAIHSGVSKDKYTQLDSIASQEDLLALFDVLQSVKDQNGNPACITANVCTANPDFDKIKADEFRNFHYKPFTETLSHYSRGKDLFGIWKEGIQQNIFTPQLHGREHLHAPAWLAELRTGNQDLLKALELETWGIPYRALLRQKRKNVQASLDIYDIEGEEEYQKNWIKDSANIFRTNFRITAKSFIPPAFTWHSHVHKALARVGVESLQGIKLQYQPRLLNTNGYLRKPHYTGKVDSSSKLVFTTRNAFFEPYVNSDKDWVGSCMAEISRAFRLNKPAIIGSHRINFIGRLDEKHRNNNLKMLKELLKKLVKVYPDVEFIHSGTLAKIIKHK